MADEPIIPDDEVEDDLFSADQRTSDAASAGEIVRKRRRKKRDADEGAEFWRACFSTPVGRRECWRILESAGTFETRFACGPNGFPQPEATWAAHGEQQLGLRLFLTWQRIDYEGVFKMIQENDPRFVKRPMRERKEGDE